MKTCTATLIDECEHTCDFAADHSADLPIDIHHCPGCDNTWTPATA